MKRKIIWLTLSSLMVLSLLLAACAPAVVEKPEVIEKPKPEVVEKPQVVETVVEKPKYGGVLRVAVTRDLTAWDDRAGSLGKEMAVQLSNETLLTGDWTKGPAGGYGAGLTTFTAKVELDDFWSGALAKDWKFEIEGDMGVLTYYIRQGVHFAVNPNPTHEASHLVGGREMTADDVIATLTRAITDPKGRWYTREPLLREAQITSPEPWVVRIKVPVEGFLTARSRFSGYMLIWPKEILEKYGRNQNMEWRVNVGTGPFVLTNNVPGSSATLVRNPNYWMKNPIGPGKGDQLPYLDGVKYFTIPDLSTLFAGLRTAQIDNVGDDSVGFSWVDAEMMLKQRPQLRSIVKGLDQAGDTISFNTRKPPFNDIRVRRALYMATDFEAIKRDYFSGHAQIVTYPFPYLVEYKDAYFGPEATGQWPADTPASVVENFTYNPEKARQLLAEAGYPQGFKTFIQHGSAAEIVDYFSIIKDMWRKVGVDLELRPMESAGTQVIQTSYDYEALYGGNSTDPQLAHRLAYMYGDHYPNMSFVNDPFINETFDKVQLAIAAGNKGEADRLVREAGKRALEQAWMIPGVESPQWILWWPWLKNYSGEFFLGSLQRYAWHFTWIDQELKKSMGY